MPTWLVLKVTINRHLTEQIACLGDCHIMLHGILIFLFWRMDHLCQNSWQIQARDACSVLVLLSRLVVMDRGGGTSPNCH